LRIQRVVNHRFVGKKSKLKTGLFVIPLIKIALDGVLNAIRFTHKIFSINKNQNKNRHYLFIHCLPNHLF